MSAEQIQQLFQSGIDHHQAGNVAAAEQVYRSVLAQVPEHVDAMHLLGVVLYQQGDYAPAQALIEKALRLHGKSAVMLNNLGMVLEAQGERRSAVGHYRKAVALKPDYALGHNNLGNALRELGQLKDADASLRRAIAIDPSYADAQNNLGVVLQMRGDVGRAAQFYRKALELKPDFVQALSNLGAALEQQGYLGDAERHLRRALALSADDSEANFNLGNMLQAQGRPDEAVDCYRKVLAGRPIRSTPAAHHNLLFCSNYLPDISMTGLYAEYQVWQKRWADVVPQPAAEFKQSRSAERRLRIGYLSPDYRQHPAAHFIYPLLAQHDRSKVEVYCYADVHRPDDMTQRFRGVADRWLAVQDFDDAALIHQIRADQVDILVDLAGHTEGNRLRALAQRVAPIQATWLGFGYTTGLSSMDYFMADEAYCPAGVEAFFSERILRLPRCMFTYEPQLNAPDIAELPMTRNGYVTFGSLSRAIRLNHRVLDTWSAVLRAVPNSKLLLNTKAFLDPDTRRRFEGLFAERDITKERLELTFTTGMEATMRSYSEMDIALDPFPHNAGTTTFEALWMGVPVLSLRDRPPLGRFGATILGAVGLSEWLVDTPDEYVQRAVAWAARSDDLAVLRSTLRDRLQQSPVCDAAGFARAVEAAYRQCWQHWCEQA